MLTTAAVAATGATTAGEATTAGAATLGTTTWRLARCRDQARRSCASAKGRVSAAGWAEGDDAGGMPANLGLKVGAERASEPALARRRKVRRSRYMVDRGVKSELGGRRELRGRKGQQAGKARRGEAGAPSSSDERVRRTSKRMRKRCRRKQNPVLRGTSRRKPKEGTRGASSESSWERVNGRSTTCARSLPVRSDASPRPSFGHHSAS